MISQDQFKSFKSKLAAKSVTLIAVSKTRSIKEILSLYQLGQRDFGENYVQELLPKYKILPKDIHWHFIGYLQTNKVKYLAPFIYLIQSVDSLKLLQEINKEAQKYGRIIDCLLEIKLGQEITKTGMKLEKAEQLLTSSELDLLKNIQIVGLMGIASNTQDKAVIQKEFNLLKNQFDAFKKKHSSFTVVSMGMTHDYEIAIKHGSTMVRLGTLLFRSVTEVS